MEKRKQGIKERKEGKKDGRKRRNKERKYIKEEGRQKKRKMEGKKGIKYRNKEGRKN